MYFLMISDDDQTTTLHETVPQNFCALGFSTRLPGPVQITTDTMLGATKRFFLPTILPHRLADCATRGINDLKGFHTLFVMLMLGWLLTLTLNFDLLRQTWRLPPDVRWRYVPNDRVDIQYPSKRFSPASL